MFGHETAVYALDIQRIPVTALAVAVQQYRPAIDSCMNGIRLYKIGALAAPDSSDPGEYGWLAYGKF